MTGSATVALRTRGMHCQSCAMLVRMSVEEVAGVSSASVDAASGSTRVTYDPDVATVAGIIGAIEAAGYDATVEE